MRSSNCPYGFNRRTDQLCFQFKTAPLHKGKHGALVTSGPRKKRNLVHRHKETSAAHFARQPIGKRSAVTRKALNKFGFKNIQMVRPAEMTQVPDDLSVSCTRCLYDWLNTGKIVMTRLRFYQMPTDTFTRYSQALSLKSLVILIG